MSLKLYDIITKKIINLKNINNEIMKKILEGKIRILSKKEYKSSNYKSYLDETKKIISDYNVTKIPLFDINNFKIFFVKVEDVYTMIKINNFRPLNKDLIEFLSNNKNNKRDETINIISNFDLSILEEKLYKSIYNTKEIAGDTTNLVNPAYSPLLNINPYLKKSSIINTALNTGLVKISDLPIDDNKLQSLYKIIKSYLFTSKEMISHMNHINQNNMNNIIKFYTIYGAYFINTYLRNKDIVYDKIIEVKINKLANLIKKSPKLDTDKVLFRFINEDSFLNNINKGDYYIENSFMSCTRKPNLNSKYNNFGFILLKINIPKNKIGSCLSIESNSTIQKEKEVILAPGSKFELISKDEEVDFYAFDKEFQRNIRKKYEFNYIGNINFIIPKKEKIVDIPKINFLNTTILGDNLEDKIEDFWKRYGKKFRKFELVLPDNKSKFLYCNFYNSTEIYSTFFYYKLIDGLFIYSYNQEGEIDMFFELGDNLIVNHISKFLSIKTSSELKLIASLICYGFRINKMIIFPNYISIGKDKFSKLVSLNEIIYKLINNKKLEYTINDKNIILNFLDSKVEISNLNYNIQLYHNNNITYKDFILKLIKNDPNLIHFLNKSLPSKITNSSYEFSPYIFLLREGLIFNTPRIFTYYENKRVNKSPEFLRIETNNFRVVK